MIYGVNVQARGISSGVFGIEVQASSVSFSEIFPRRLFFLTEETNSTPEGAYNEFYSEAYN